MEIRQELKHNLKQQQWMKLQTMQFMKILALPSLELKQFIRGELEENPVLELEEKKEETVEDIEEQEEKISDQDENGEDTPNFTRQNENRDTTAGILEKTIYEGESLSEYLMEQLSLDVDDFTKLKIGEFIIGNIDEKGYLRITVEEISSLIRADKSLVEETLKIIQGFDPLGVGARDLKECLLIQLKEQTVQDFSFDLAEKIIASHLEDLGEGKFNKIAKTLNVNEEEVKEINQKIISLNPFPGETFGGTDSKNVLPEVIIKEENGKYFVSANNDVLPHLRINDAYKKITFEKDQKTKKYIKEKINSAEILLKSLGQRKELLQKIAYYFIENQADFLVKGISYLKPMTMDKMAKIQGVHPSTIGRAISGKYIQTPMGIFPFKFFFSYEVSHEGVSQSQIKHRISELIKNEDSIKPLSDSEISAKLKEEGFNISRRTISKYREAMNIPSTLKRRTQKQVTS